MYVDSKDKNTGARGARGGGIVLSVLSAGSCVYYFWSKSCFSYVVTRILHQVPEKLSGLLQCLHQPSLHGNQA